MFSIHIQATILPTVLTISYTACLIDDFIAFVLVRRLRDLLTRRLSLCDSITELPLSYNRVQCLDISGRGFCNIFPDHSYTL